MRETTDYGCGECYWYEPLDEEEGKCLKRTRAIPMPSQEQRFITQCVLAREIACPGFMARNTPKDPAA